MTKDDGKSEVGKLKVAIELLLSLLATDRLSESMMEDLQLTQIYLT